jgi:hypothetical protein
MSINTISANQSVDYSAFRNGIDGSKITEQFYLDLKGVEGVGRTKFATMTQEALAETSTSIKVTNCDYEVDEKGFFGADFNKAMGIPENIKIHQAMLTQAAAYSQAQGENIDPATVISKVWKLFSTIAGGTLDPDKDGYISQKEINAMPKSYITKGSLMDGIVSVQTNNADVYTAANTSYDVATASGGSLDSGFRGFTLYSAYSRTDTDPEVALFGHREMFEEYSGVEYDDNLPTDKISVGELFDSFFYQRVDAETAAYVYGNAHTDVKNQLTINPNATKKFYEYLESGQDMQTYLKNTKGEDYLKNLIKELGTLANGSFSSELVDKFFEELDKEQKELYAQYKANNYSELESPKNSSQTSNLASKAKLQNSTITSTTLSTLLRQ